MKTIIKYGIFHWLLSMLLGSIIISVLEYNFDLFYTFLIVGTVLSAILAAVAILISYTFKNTSNFKRIHLLTSFAIITLSFLILSIAEFDINFVVNAILSLSASSVLSTLLLNRIK